MQPTHEELRAELEDLRDLLQHRGWKRVMEMIGRKRHDTLNKLYAASEGDSALWAASRLAVLDMIDNWVQSTVSMNAAILNRTKEK